MAKTKAKDIYNCCNCGKRGYEIKGSVCVYCGVEKGYVKYIPKALNKKS